MVRFRPLHARRHDRACERIDGLFAVEEGEDSRAGDVLSQIRVKVVNGGLATAFEVTERQSAGELYGALGALGLAS